MALFYVTGSKHKQRDPSLPLTTNDVNHNSPIGSDRKLYPIKPISQDKRLNGTQLNDEFIYKGKSKRCNKYRLLIVLLVIFIFGAFLMASLFLWQLHLNNNRSFVKEIEKIPNAVRRGGCNGLPQPIALPDIQQRLSSVIKHMEETMERNSAKTGAISANLVYRDKVIWSGAFGVMNTNEFPARKPTTATIYPCASVSKVFTALIIYKLLDENMISSLDDPVKKYDSDFKINNPFKNNHDITLRNLLDMSSGIPREAPCYPPKGDNVCPYSHKVIMKRIRNASLLVEPDTVLQYSNFGYGLLGNVIAKRFSGGDFDALVKKYVLDPLGMKDTVLSLTTSQIKEVPVVYLKGKLSPVVQWGWLDPAGGFFTTVQDLAKMTKELMSDKYKDRYLSKFVTRKLFSVAKILADGTSMVGTPWEMNLVQGIRYSRKGGAVYGYNSEVIMVPELRIGELCALNECVVLKLSSKYIYKQLFYQQNSSRLKEASERKTTTGNPTNKTISSSFVKGLLLTIILYAKCSLLF